jgi:sugar O-acyltransferase (sialic acid O-acetyltransferase NeuD family)
MGFLSDSAISSVVIAGTGGFSLEVFDYVEFHASHGGPMVAGFIDPVDGATAPEGVDRPLLGTLDTFRPEPGQVVIVAIGSVAWRSAALRRLWALGVPTPAFVDDRALLSPHSTVGRGAIVCPMSIVNRCAHVGDGALINVHCSVGHGAKVGDHAILSPYAALNGNAVVGEGCFLGTRATIYPGIAIGDGCVVDSHTGVRAPAEARHLISSRGTYSVLALRG